MEQGRDACSRERRRLTCSEAEAEDQSTRFDARTHDLLQFLSSRREASRAGVYLL